MWGWAERQRGLGPSGLTQGYGCSEGTFWMGWISYRLKARPNGKWGLRELMLGKEPWITNVQSRTLSKKGNSLSSRELDYLDVLSKWSVLLGSRPRQTNAWKRHNHRSSAHKLCPNHILVGLVTCDCFKLLEYMEKQAKKDPSYGAQTKG